MTAATRTEIALVDLSSIAYPIWHQSGSQPDPDWTATQIVARVRALTSQHPKAAICCDKGKSFRAEINPSYKAQREAAPEALHHQIALAKERLATDGFPVWQVPGLEADDLIATATHKALAFGCDVLVISADKDLLQLVGMTHIQNGGRVRALSPTSGSTYDPEAVLAKFGVYPYQMRDYLTLVGDASDNIKGAKGIGGKKAADLLARYDSIEGIYDNLTKHGTQFTPALATALREFEPRLAETRALVTLRTDAEIPFGELDNDRVPTQEPLEAEMCDTTDSPQPANPTAAPAAPAGDSPRVVPSGGDSGQSNQSAPLNGNGSAKESDVLAPAPVEFERQLEPRSLGQAYSLSKAMHQARMFNGYGSAEAVLSTVLAGRELGLQAVASLRGFHVIEGKHALAADAMRGLVLRSGRAKHFRVVERTAERATFETWRVGEPEPVRLTYTIEEGYAAFQPTAPEDERKKKWAASAWGKHPADMLAARASSKLARLVYADILFGLYSPEELRD